MAKERVVPFLLEERLKELGGHYTKARAGWASGVGGPTARQAADHGTKHARVPAPALLLVPAHAPSPLHQARPPDVHSSTHRKPARAQ